MGTPGRLCPGPDDGKVADDNNDDDSGAWLRPKTGRPLATLTTCAQHGGGCSFGRCYHRCGHHRLQECIRQEYQNVTKSITKQCNTN
eukprot:scaffold42818_cov34-Prasinocladus_malaysianus.AAC.3